MLDLAKKKRYQKAKLATRVAMDDECNSIKLENLYEFVSKYRLTPTDFKKLKSPREIVISISRNGLLKSCARFVIERSEIRKKQHAFKSVYFECRN